MFPDALRPFSTQYKVYSVSMLPGNEREDVERGGKIIMPPSALDQLTRLNIEYPMLFKLTNKKTNRITHCGVLEFVADEGKIYIPYWMMRNLLVEEGGLLQVDSVSLPVATFSKFQPQAPDFLDITNPKAVLENELRSFACLTTGDVIAIKYNQRIYELNVLETKPGNAVSIIECDMNVEFATPIGYKEPERNEQYEPEELDSEEEDVVTDCGSFLPFAGVGVRLDGKEKRLSESSSSTSTTSQTQVKRGIPNYNYKKNKLTFIHINKPVSSNDKTSTDDFQAFSGAGQTLRQHKSRK